MNTARMDEKQSCKFLIHAELPSDGETGAGPAQQGRMRPVRWETGAAHGQATGGGSTTLPGERIGKDLEREGVPAGGDPHGKPCAMPDWKAAYATTAHQSRHRTRVCDRVAHQGAGKAAAFAKPFVWKVGGPGLSPSTF